MISSASWPEQGGVLIFLRGRTMAPRPTMPTEFVKWLGGDLPKDTFAKVRYAVFGCGNSDWLATYQSIPRFIDEQLAAHGASNAFIPRRGRRARRSRRPVRILVSRKLRPPGGKANWASIRASIAAPTTSRFTEIEPVAADGSQFDRRTRRCRRR